MNAGREMTKTLLFVCTAVAILAVAFFSRPSKEQDVVDDEVGKIMFTALNNPSMVNGLEVLSFDEDMGQISRFKVTQQEQGPFVIPSHQNYPADAQDRLVSAATMLVDLKIVRVVPGTTEADYESFGVVEPSTTGTRIGDEGVGMLVSVFGKGEQGQTTLANVIIGKPVKNLAGQHYVRRPGKSRVYQVAIDPTQLSTRFQDWIETDLLKLSLFDVGALTLKDYSVEAEGNNVFPDQRLELKTRVEGDGWALDDLKEGVNGKLQAGQLEEGEELNQTRLNVLRNALGDLKIVDVQRKPRGLGADLKASGEFLGDPESVRSLVERGFYAARFPDGSTKFVSSDGELLIDTKTGVRYTLRFGRSIGGVGQSATPGVNNLGRFMFVSVSLNEELFPEPELEELPEGDENDSEVALEIERIQKANKRKTDARNDAIEAAEQRVEDLQYRFADWYYIVGEDVFKKLRLRRNDLFTFSEDALKSGTGIRSFRELQRQGLK